jgi:hypothetical protein
VGLKEYEAAKPFAASAAAHVRPYLPLWARDAPWAWWAGGWSVVLLFVASLRTRKVAIKSAPATTAAKPIALAPPAPTPAPAAPAAAAAPAPPETPSNGQWVPPDFSSAGLKVSSRRKDEPDESHVVSFATATTDSGTNEAAGNQLEEAAADENVDSPVEAAVAAPAKLEATSRLNGAEQRTPTASADSVVVVSSLPPSPACLEHP